MTYDNSLVENIVSTVNLLVYQIIETHIQANIRYTDSGYYKCSTGIYNSHFKGGGYNVRPDYGKDRQIMNLALNLWR